MSLLWQLSSEYGKKDQVWILRDIDLAFWVWYDHPTFWPIFQNTREKIIALLSEMPDKWAKVRNKVFQAKDIIVRDELLIWENKTNLQWIDVRNFEHQRMLLLRQMLLRNPEKTLDSFIKNINEELREFGIPKEDIVYISKININCSFISDVVLVLWNNPSHIAKIALFERCITEWKFLSEIAQIANNEIEELGYSKESSAEYWDYVNLRTLAKTRKKILGSEFPAWSKSFSLSGGAGNSFSQLAIMQKYVEDGWKIRSISGTSAGSAIAVLVAAIGNNSKRLQELMDDFKTGNENWEIPEKLAGHEEKMKIFFNKLASKYGITDSMKFSELKIPVLVNAGRQYKGGEQEVVLGEDENIMDAIWASQNVPKLNKPWKNTNEWEMWITKVHGVPMIDYAANERWNPTHWLDIVWVDRKDMAVIDVGYSSEKWGSPFVRRLFTRANIRDHFAKIKIKSSWGIVIDMPLDSSEWYNLIKWKLEYFFSKWRYIYQQHFTSPPSR
jgi:hypothetical protein